MKTSRQIKEDVVREISEKISNSKSLIVASYEGLTVKELQELRSLLSEKNVELKVFKNRLFKIAIDQTDFKEINKEVTGQNIFAFGLDDDISPAKILSKFAKDHEKLVIKAGTYEGKVIDAAGVNEVATLPTMEEALTKLALALLTPIKDLGVGLNLLVEEGHLSGETNTETQKEGE
ncbi:MAG: 50S ribosomal protein L10 [Mycoplasmataceae bacterium]|nr:50S ribosomal protein L10 [Mycoplasmataceae bacterium]